jgi:hypothetical protein
MTTTLEDLFGPVIHAYTRKQAIADGVLVDLSNTTDVWVPAMVREAGITIPVAMTTTAFVDCVSPIEGDGQQLAPGQDIKGRLWDVLWMFVCAVRSGGQDESEILFRLRVVPNIPVGSNRHPRAKLVTLKAVIGGDDNGDPCITIMYPHED